MTDESKAPPDQGGMLGYCRQRAIECLEAAEGAANSQTRDDWIELANLWTHIALRTGGVPDSARRARRDSA